MKIAIYIQHKYGKANYKTESYNIRLFTGVEVCADVLRRNGIEVSYCDMHTVSNFDIVMVAITSGCDWWSYIQERLKWKGRIPKVICGGAGVLNIRPFLDFFDVAVFGRSEGLILDIVNNIQDCEKISNSILLSNEFSIDKTYKINQSEPYPHQIKIGFGTCKESMWKETGIGCKRKCFFCAYTWHREFQSSNDKSFQADGADKEYTMLDLDLDKIETLPKNMRVIAIDGLSERLRFAANKKISRDLLVKFLRVFAENNTSGQIKIYCVIGYPGETQSDADELIETIKQADMESRQMPKQQSYVFGVTPFRPMPCTPCAEWEMSYRDYRKNSVFQKHRIKGNVFYQGKSMWAVEWMGTDSISTVMLDAIALRGTEHDAESIRLLCSNNKFWGADSTTKQKTIEHYFDAKKLFSSYKKQELPTRYLKSYWEK